MPRAATTSDAFNAVAEPRRRDILEFLAPRRTAGQRRRRRAEAGAAVGVEAPAGAAPRRARGRAARRPAAALSHQRRGPEAAARVDRPVRTLLAQPAAARQGTRRAAEPNRSSRTRRGNHHDSAIAPGIEHLSINITQEIHVRASLEATFAALLEEMGPGNQGHARRADADDARGVARRPLVPRPRRRQRPPLGTRAGDQAADAARDRRAADDVVRRSRRTCSTG